MAEPEHSADIYLERISKDMKIIRELMSKVVNYMSMRESEIPGENASVHYVHARRT